MHILIIQTAFIGDVVLAAPLITGARRRYPDSKIDFLTIPYSAPALRNHPELDNVIVFEKRGRRGILDTISMMKRLKRGDYDLALIPHRSLRSAVLASMAGIPQRIGFDRSAGRILLTKTVKYRRDWHKVKRNLSLLGLEDEASDFPPEIFPGDIEQRKVASLLKDKGIGGDYIVIAPGSIWATKRWLKESFRGLLTLMKAKGFPKAALAGSAGERKLCEYVAEGMAGYAVVTAGLLDPLESAALMAGAKLVVSNDSAAGHLAAAVGTKVVSIFGPTVPAFGFAPFGEGHRIVEHPDLYCRPCRIHGSRRCPEKHFRCMREIKPEKVLTECVQVYKCTGAQVKCKN